MKNENRFYVYVFLDPRKEGKFKYGDYEFEYEPFYVGKGQGARYKRHFTGYCLNNDRNKSKVNKIKKIQSIGLEIKIIKSIENVIECIAQKHEMELITLIGRNDLKLGCLTNLTDGGDGVSGHVVSEEQKEKLRNRVVSNITRKRISEANTGNVGWCRGQTKETNGILKRSGEFFSKNYKDGLYSDRSGGNNSNHGNRWTDDQKEKASEKHKGQWIGDKNPSRINPKSGKKNGISKYKYWLYDKDELVDVGYSLTVFSKIHGLNYNMIRKISINGNIYLKRYTIKREKWR